MKRILPILLIVLMPACATPYKHWLTDKEDAELRAKCEPVGGCAAIPYPLWDQIKALLRSMRGTAI